MGFFDEPESSSSDGEKAASEEKQSGGGGDEDEEDPLDAYMKSLEGGAVSEPQQPGTSTRSTEQRPHERLDLENEDEDDDDDEEEEETFRNSGASSSGRSNREAKQSLDSTFRRAADYHAASETAAAVDARKCFWRGSATDAGRAWRRDHQVTLSPLCGGGGRGSSNNNNNSNTDNIQMDPVRSFEELESGLLSSQLPNGDRGDDDDETTATRRLCQTIRRQFAAPTTVQAQTLSLALSGRDCVVTAATGQGKTLSYLWPAIVHCRGNVPPSGNSSSSNSALRAVVLVPTRELAVQVHAQAAPLMDAVRLRSHCVTGGQGRWKLRQELSSAAAAAGPSGGGVNLVVATPGRLLDVASGSSSSSDSAKKRGLSLHATSFVVLDEADKLLQMGFEPQVRQILQRMPPTRQTLLLSATLGRRVEQVAREWLLHRGSAVRIAVGRTGAASAHVAQHVHVLPDAAAKDAFVVELLPALAAVGRTLIFVATREGCERLAATVRAQCPTTKVATLHGDRHQSDRTKAVRALTKGKLSVLIASDVAARGLDLPQVQTVLQLDPAKNWDAHVHRVGRAGRLSAEHQQQTGTAHTLLTPRDGAFAKVLVRAFQREGREVTPELRALANSSSQPSPSPPQWHGRSQNNNNNNNNSSSRVRTHGNQAGLGYAPPHDGSGAANNCYYGPNGGAAPPAKRGRWS